MLCGNVKGNEIATLNLAHVESDFLGVHDFTWFQGFFSTGFPVAWV
jgi:hypothetical protein